MVTANSSFIQNPIKFFKFNLFNQSYELDSVIPAFQSLIVI